MVSIASRAGKKQNVMSSRGTQSWRCQAENKIKFYFLNMQTLSMLWDGWKDHQGYLCVNHMLPQDEPLLSSTIFPYFYSIRDEKCKENNTDNP